MASQLVDKFGRVHDYLRISLLERCNLRCTYCMPADGIVLRDKAEFMTQEDLFFITEKFVSLGVKKIRLTGGEPLLKKNFNEIIQHFSTLPVELTLTTNGVLLDKSFEALARGGVKKINISLDSLIEKRFNEISRRTDFKRIRKNIDAALDFGFDVKLNCVLMKGINDDEIIDFIKLSKDSPLKIRFIEFMPFDGNEWDWTKKVAFSTIMEEVESHFGREQVTQLNLLPNSTSKNFKIKGFIGDFGIISTLTNPFCDTCNRIRLTADGKIKNCLFSAQETDLLGAHRSGREIEPLILSSILDKHEKRAGIESFEDGEGQKIYSQNRTMTSIGG
jgi:cyclic pyranopterin phosphate synthase